MVIILMLKLRNAKLYHSFKIWWIMFKLSMNFSLILKFRLFQMTEILNYGKQKSYNDIFLY